MKKGNGEICLFSIFPPFFLQRNRRELMKIAFLFPGQGSQKAQMGLEIAENFEVAKAVFEEASNVLPYCVTDIISEEPATRINQTEYTQPLLLTVSRALASVLEQEGITPDVAAGLSLGEYSALVEAGVLSFKEALNLVAKRGQYMQEAVVEGEGKMVAVLGLEDNVIEDICREVSTPESLVVPSNYNTPGQLVIGGHADAVEVASGKCLEAGAKKAVPLVVSGPFHTPLMEAAKVRFAPEMEAAELHESKCPVLSNTLGTPHEGVPSKDVLCDQITNAVKWKQNVEWMLQDGVEVFIEVGPGKTLTQMVKQIAKAKGASVQLFQTDSLKAMTETIEKVKELKG